MALLDVAGVSKRFHGVQALDGVSMTVSHGEIVGIIGPNGAGKTTLFNCISGFEEPDEGSVRLEGTALRSLAVHDRARLGIGRTFQTVQPFAGLSVFDMLRVAADQAVAWRLEDAGGKPEPAARELAEAVLSFCGLDDVRDRRAAELPLGTARRAEFGRALCLRPRLLLLDEPSSGMDRAETAELAELVFRVREFFRLAVLYVEHDLEFVAAVADHVYVLHFGRIIAQGTPDEVYADSSGVDAYLGSRDAARR